MKNNDIIIPTKKAKALSDKYGITLNVDELINDIKNGKWHFEPEILVTEQHIDEDGRNIIDKFELKSISFVKYMEEEECA